MKLKLLILNTLVGIISGLVSGVTGEPGFALLLPLLLIFHITDNYKVAIGTILICAIAPLSLLSITQYYKNNTIHYYKSDTIPTKIKKVIQYVITKAVLHNIIKNNTTQYYKFIL